MRYWTASPTRAVAGATGASSNLAIEMLEKSSVVGTALDGACFEGLLAGQGQGHEPQPRRPRNSCDLTERELEVLRLACTGLTNREIATRLVLSGKTVARHLSNIFTKIGVSSRAGATAYAFENGIVSART